MHQGSGWAALVVQTLLGMRISAAAQDDVDLISNAVLAEPSPAAASLVEAEAHPTLAGRYHLEDAFTLASSPADVPVPYPSPLVDWQNRSSLDVSLRWRPSQALVIGLSNRLNVLGAEGQRFLSGDSLRNDFREGYAAWQPIDNTYLELGRINVRKGVALGFNPTDFFKTGTLVGQASLDPSVLRRNRLGALMARWQAIWAGGSAAIAFAPKVAGSAEVGGDGSSGLDPRFDATNGAYRVLCSLEFDVLDLNPELLAYFELHRSKIGLNLSRPIGGAVIAYAEWAGGLQANLIARATDYGRATGTLPLSAPVLPATKTSTEFQNDLATGVSWTIATELTLNVEYHFHRAGFTRDDWRRWFDVGGAPDASPLLAGQLWYVRAFANHQQEPVSMHQMFVRAAWPRAFVHDLELEAFALVELPGRSALSQLSASYHLSSAWTTSAYASANLGDPESERGSFPQRVNLIIQLTRYL